MVPRRTTSGLALSATAALLASAVSTVALSSSATAAPGDPAATVTVEVIGSSTQVPGRTHFGEVRLRAADGTPVDAGTTVTLSVDHGFFTSGDPRTAPVQGQPAGVLDVIGATTTVKTTDGSGIVDFDLAIERDAGFDDDGAVTAVVTATSGTATGRDSAEWVSDDPLNGALQVVLSPASQQEGPVAPTVAFDRTYFDVVATDQFGNPVIGAEVESGLSGTTGAFDYSPDFEFLTTDRALDGDFWVESDVAADLAITSTWLDAPTYRYDATGTAVSRDVDLDARATASYYAVDFNASSYSLVPSVPGESPVGTTITQTVTVTDQLGRPVRGYDVRFFRFGPEAAGGDEKGTRETNARGQATYSFVGTGPGVAKTTAVVSDGLRNRTLVSEVGFKHVTSVSAAAAKSVTKGKKGKKGKKAAKVKVDPAGADVLTISSQKVAAGAAVTVFRVKGTSRKVVGRSARLDASGSVSVEIKDKNKKRATTYVVVLQPSTTTFGSTSAPVKAR